MLDLGLDATDAQLTDLFSRFDTDNSGLLEIEELRDALRKLQDISTEAKASTADAQVQVAELRRRASTIGEEAAATALEIAASIDGKVQAAAEEAERDMRQKAEEAKAETEAKAAAAKAVRRSAASSHRGVSPHSSRPPQQRAAAAS